MEGLDRAQGLADACPDTGVVNVRDRGGDFRRPLPRAGEKGAELLVRASNGSVRSDDSMLNSVLNLNLAFLKQNRKGVLDGFLQWWRRRKPVPRDRIEREILRLAPADGWLDPYCEVTVWWLNRKLSQMQR